MLVEVEVDGSNGLEAFIIVGFPNTSVNESRERVRSAVKNIGCLFPFKRITVNLAPADLRKEGPSYDIPIAAGIHLASGQIAPNDRLTEILFLGEPSLGGSLRHERGAEYCHERIQPLGCAVQGVQERLFEKCCKFGPYTSLYYNPT